MLEKLRKNQPPMSGLEWVIILFVGDIPFYGGKLFAEAQGFGYWVSMGCGTLAFAISLFGYVSIRRDWLR